MNTVQPIRNKKQIQAMKTLLKEKNEKYYIMYIIGINVGLRISDILQLRVSDVIDTDHITIKEKKTNKTKRFLLNNQMQKEIMSYIESNNLRPTNYLVYNRNNLNQPISRIQAYRILNDTADSIGLDEVGTHTLRKTFGYWHYQQYKDVAILQSLFNHSSPSITLRYIGITDDEKDNTMAEFYL